MWRSKRLVRVHFRGDEATLDGVLVARNTDHYRIALPKVLQTDSSDDLRTTPLEGEAEVPRERVLFLQLLGKAA
jgi:hypothetical protein